MPILDATPTIVRELANKALDPTLIRASSSACGTCHGGCGAAIAPVPLPHSHFPQRGSPLTLAQTEYFPHGGVADYDTSPDVLQMPRAVRIQTLHIRYSKIFCALLTMGMLSILFGCKKKESDHPTVWFNINAPLAPMDRGELFEDPLYEWLAQNGGEPVGGGGGTSFGGDGHATCDFSVDLASRDQIEGAIHFVESLGVPEGSSYAVGDSQKVLFGDRKCLILSVQKQAVEGDAFSKFLESVRSALGKSGTPMATNSCENLEELWVYGKDLTEMERAVQTICERYPSVSVKPLKTNG